ncbi:MAG: hypothetical protein P4L90_10195 [Rhodopila sp.]|nr:hypothetical protein [Rhodopila sp.]
MSTERLREIVGIHADNLDDTADAMEADGIGLHPVDGHTHHIRRLANDMRAAAAGGALPFAYHDRMGVHASAGQAPLPGQIMSVMAAAGLDPRGRFTLAELDAAMRKSDVTMSDRFQVKNTLASLGRISS